MSHKHFDESLVRRDLIGRFATKELGGGGVGIKNVLGHRIERPARKPDTDVKTHDPTSRGWAQLSWGTPGVNVPPAVLKASAELNHAIRVQQEPLIRSAYQTLATMVEEGKLPVARFNEIVSAAHYAARWDV